MTSTRKATLTAIDTYTSQEFNRETGELEPRDFLAFRFTPVRGSGTLTHWSRLTKTNRTIGLTYQCAVVDGNHVLTAKVVSA